MLGNWLCFHYGVSSLHHGNTFLRCLALRYQRCRETLVGLKMCCKRHLWSWRQIEGLLTWSCTAALGKCGTSWIRMVKAKLRCAESCLPKINKAHKLCTLVILRPSLYPPMLLGMVMAHPASKWSLKAYPYHYLGALVAFTKHHSPSQGFLIWSKVLLYCSEDHFSPQVKDLFPFAWLAAHDLLFCLP